jgi:hypothetical protein
MNDELNPAPLANGSAEGLGPVPVMETIPVAPMKRRKRKAKPAAPKVARAPKPRFDPIRDEASKASSTNSPVAMVAAPIEEAPTPTLLTGVGADHLIERRERIHARQFDADARALVSPPIKSTWGQRFVFGLRRMTGFDSAADPEPFALSSTLKALLVAAVCVSSAGVYLAWF